MINTVGCLSCNLSRTRSKLITTKFGVISTIALHKSLLLACASVQTLETSNKRSQSVLLLLEN